MSFAYSDIKNDCYIGRVLYQVGDDTCIIIPDESDGYPVTSLGGYYGTGFPDPFRISFVGYDNYDDPELEDHVTSGKFSVDEELLYNGFFDGMDITVEDMHFYITLPSGLEETNLILCREIYYDKQVLENGDIKIGVLRPVYHLEISDKNTYFYTENGRLYNKKTNELVSGFIYDNYVAPDAQTE